MKAIFNNKKFNLQVILTFVIVLSGSCVKDDFDAPPAKIIPEGNILTISELRSLYQGTPLKFDDDYSVYATITMDDKSGNIYRASYAQDETGAINIRQLSAGGLYQGDSVRIYLKGTTLSSYNNMLQIDSLDVDRNIVKQKTKVPVEPKVLTIQQINTGNYQAQLVKLENVQFVDYEVGQPFANAKDLITLNRMLEDCNGNKIIVRTSGYASFADNPVPEGNGSLVAIISEFNGTMQLYIRNMAEVVMDDQRCETGDGLELLTIAQVRNLYTGASLNIPAGKKILGVIISDRANSNLTSRNAHILDSEGNGIVLRFTANHNFNMGDRVQVDISGIELSRFNGLLQLNDIPNAKAIKVGDGIIPDPLNVTINNITGNIAFYESKLVRISNVTITGSPGTYSGTKTITDSSGSMMLYTTTYASFAAADFPTAQVTITGIVSVFTNPQLIIRNLNDVVVQ
jgi:hypothetical protein